MGSLVCIFYTFSAGVTFKLSTSVPLTALGINSPERLWKSAVTAWGRWAQAHAQLHTARPHGLAHLYFDAPNYTQPAHTG
eukprot:362139-Chlamydomonas_euryale.AAC.4